MPRVLKKDRKLLLVTQDEREELLVSHTGDVLNEDCWPDYSMHTRVNGKLIYFPLDSIMKYGYNAEIGYVYPHDQGLKDACMRSTLLIRGAERDLLGQYGAFINRSKPFIEQDENTKIKYLSSNFRQAGGGQLIEDGRSQPIIGTTFRELGGMRYTFGLELETAGGRLTHDDLAVANTAMEGDRTINGYEYVTNILSGDQGLRRVEALASAIRHRTVIGEGNGLHIHIGGFEDSKVWTPRFNRMFSIHAIKLGNQIEDEMMELLHPKRRNDRFLQSIKEWGNINNSNWREVLGDYVFRGSEDPFKEYKNYQTHSLDEQYNSNFKISRWAKTKHKWMNLNHCNSTSRQTTIEFRLYSSTGNYKKIYNFLLLSMAIVWFIESRQRLIWAGNVTLKTIIHEAYGKRGNSKLAATLYRFIKTRTVKFKVGNNEKVNLKF